jgi:hypothetical protein
VPSGAAFSRTPAPAADFQKTTPCKVARSPRYAANPWVFGFNLTRFWLQLGPAMPLLPLNRPEPFSATLGVMLYPDDPAKARAFAAQFLAKPYREFRAAGHRLSHEAVEQLLIDSGERLRDLGARWWQGTTAGELLKTLFALYNTRPALASLNNAVRISSAVARRSGAKCSRTEILAAWRRYLRVAHLWAALCIRERKFSTDVQSGYDGSADFQSFLAEAETIRNWGQNWRQPRAKSKPPLPAEVWRVPDGWQPPIPRHNWPRSVGQVPVLTIPDDLLCGLQPAGRPSSS